MKFVQILIGISQWVRMNIQNPRIKLREKNFDGYSGN